jgi:hypothetical protein
MASPEVAFTVWLRVGAEMAALGALHAPHVTSNARSEPAHVAPPAREIADALLAA